MDHKFSINLWPKLLIIHAKLYLEIEKKKAEALEAAGGNRKKMEFDIKKEFLEAYEKVLEESEFKESLLLLPEIKEEFTKEKPLSSDLQKLRLEKIKKKYL